MFLWFEGFFMIWYDMICDKWYMCVDLKDYFLEFWFRLFLTVVVLAQDEISLSITNVHSQMAQWPYVQRCCSGFTPWTWSWWHWAGAFASGHHLVLLCLCGSCIRAPLAPWWRTVSKWCLVPTDWGFPGSFPPRQPPRHKSPKKIEHTFCVYEPPSGSA